MGEARHDLLNQPKTWKTDISLYFIALSVEKTVLFPLQIARSLSLITYVHGTVHVENSRKLFFKTRDFCEQALAGIPL